MSTRKEKAPDAGQGVEGISSRKEPVDMSTTVRPRGKYANYTVEVDDIESASDPWYEDQGSHLLKVHYRVFRIPSKKKLVLRHFAASTAEDRAEAESMLPKLPRAFEIWEGIGKARRKVHTTKRYVYFTVPAGHFVDDPLIQLELEMMIDNDATIDDLLRKADELGLTPSTILEATPKGASA